MTPDALYRPFGGLSPWLTTKVDHRSWDDDLEHLRAWRSRDPGRMDMIQRGAMLASAHRSAAQSGQLPDDGELALSLLRGEASVASLADDPRAHIVANYDALVLARAGGPDPEALLRQVHATSCRPQATYRVATASGEEDHVLAHGDYKHHPNHIRRPDGSWRATVPVALLGAEMAGFAEAMRDPVFGELHPLIQAASVLHGLAHIVPFEAGNGRVARALASSYLLQAGGPPLVVFPDAAPDAGDPAALVEFVAHRCSELVRLIGDAFTSSDSAAAAAWQQRVVAAAALAGLIPVAVTGALERHRGRPHAAWQSDLGGARVVAPVSPGAPLVVRIALEGGEVVEETVDIDPHPVDGKEGDVALRAAGAGLELRLDVDGLIRGLDSWLDRVVVALSVRVAAALE